MVCLIMCLCYVERINFYVSGEKEYYEKQVATLRSFEEVDSLVSPRANDELDRQEETQHERAINISNWANIFLLVLKVNSYMIRAMRIFYDKFNQMSRT